MTTTEAEAPLISAYAADPDMAELCAEYAAGLPAALTALEVAVEAGDRARVRTVAHQLKGSGGSYGFPRLSAAAAMLERAARTEDAPMTAELADLASVVRRIGAASL